MIRKKHAGEYQVDYDGKPITFILILSRRKTLTIRIRPDRTITVDAPTRTPIEYVREVVQKKGAWITRKLAELASYPTLPSPRQYVTGEQYPYLGQNICLQVEIGNISRVTLRGDSLMVTTPTPDNPLHVEKLIRSWYKRQAEHIFTERLAACQPKATALGITAPQKLTVRWMKTRWGSCSGKGRITLSIRLIQAELDLIDYVILHELCHLKELNHSKRFYDLMTRILPDWKIKRLALNRSPMAW